MSKNTDVFDILEANDTKQPTGVYRSYAETISEESKHRNLDQQQIAERFQAMLGKAIADSEGLFSGYLGSIILADGSEARLELRIDADYFKS